ncbi:DUF962-domain-containing protein [Dichomitus squalens]|uniref:DUF962-domain-containing protein n=1 Tax=Dichomitus squalens TaxID=114155 RepID=A0A4Q9Q9I2_9APHY|nr:DUF962-domain-containing protein [Dichomitus squalens]TBU64199.1 DUF962-domain-containing protein [Dichomitus squalens]
MFGLLNVKKQLIFYGAYHDNPVNVAIHMIFVPVLVWTGLVLGSRLPVPSSFPQIHAQFNEYLAFDFNWSALWGIANWAYYFALEPTAALIYAPEYVLIVLTASAYSHKPNSFNEALAVHVVSWIAQFAGHFLAEGRAPALLDNLLGALVLAPFFVHLELLFKFFGYNPSLQKSVHQGITEEIARIKAVEGKKAH